MRIFSLGFFDLFLKAWSNLRDSSFYVEKRTSGKVKFHFCERFLQRIDKIFISGKRLSARQLFYVILRFSRILSVSRSISYEATRIYHVYY